MKIFRHFRDEGKNNKSDANKQASATLNDERRFSYMTASTHFGRKYNQGSRKNVASRTRPEHTKDAIWVRPPTSPFIRDLHLIYVTRRTP